MIRSLRLKILAWALVNFALIAAGTAWFLRAQFRVGVHSILAGPTGARLEALGRPLAGELLQLPEGRWPEALGRVRASLPAGVNAALYRNTGRAVAGEPAALPRELQELIEAHDAKMGGPKKKPKPRGGPPGDRPEPPRPPPDDRPSRPESDITTEPSGFEKFMLVTDSPRTYWAGVHLDSPAGPLPATLVLSSPSLRGGGLFFDYVPWLALGGGLALASVLLWLPFVHRLTGTLSRLTASAESIAGGKFEPLPATTRRDELGRLHNAHRHMAGRIEGFVTGQRRFLGDTAHELLSPLARLELALSLLEQKCGPDGVGYAERALGDVRHISALVHELLAFSKTALTASHASLEPVPLAELARKVVAVEAEHARVEVQIPEDLRVLAAPRLLERALANVVRNAVRYAAADGPIRLTAEPHGSQAVIRLTDQGPGVPVDALPRLFDPFFRPDVARTAETGGVGLGLAIVKTCVEACHGTVSAHLASPRGLVVEFALATAHNP